MKIEVQKPNIVRIVYIQQTGDPHYGSCLWAYFDLDIDHGIMAVLSDCGFYAYRWPEQDEDFLRLMGGVDADYLSEKLGRDTPKKNMAYVRRVAQIYEKHCREKVREYIDDTYERNCGGECL